MLTQGLNRQGQHRACRHMAPNRWRCHSEAAQHLYELGVWGEGGTVLAGKPAQLGAHRRVPAAEDVDVCLEHADLWAHLPGQAVTQIYPWKAAERVGAPRCGAPQRLSAYRSEHYVVRTMVRFLPVIRQPPRAPDIAAPASNPTWSARRRMASVGHIGCYCQVAAHPPGLRLAYLDRVGGRVPYPTL